MTSTVRRVNFVLVTLLSLAAGIPKIMRVPEEVAFFESSGFGGNAVVLFGVIQLVGGVLLVLPRTRRWGAVVAAVAFLGSAVMVLLSGQIAFGLVSLVPAVMAGFVTRDSIRPTRDRDTKENA